MATPRNIKLLEENQNSLYGLLKVLSECFPGTKMSEKIITKRSSEDILQLDMFKKANTKAMQAIFYSLIWILNKNKCNNLPWPIAFRADSYKFRQGVVNFITDECPDFKVPKLASALLSNPSGDKFVQFLLNFTIYVTQRVILKHHRVAVLHRPISEEFESQWLFSNVTKQMMIEEHFNAEQHRLFLTDANDLSKSMLTELESIKVQIENGKSRLSSMVECLPGNNCEMKALLLDVNNPNGIIEWYNRNKKDTLAIHGYREQVSTNTQKYDQLQKLIMRYKELSNIQLDGSVLDISISDYVTQLTSTDRQEYSRLLYRNGKLSLQNLMIVNLEILKKLKQKINETKPTEKCRNIYSNLNDLVKTMKLALESNQQMESDMEYQVNEKRLQIEELKAVCCANISPKDVQLMEFILSSNKLPKFSVTDDDHVTNELAERLLKSCSFNDKKYTSQETIDSYQDPISSSTPM